MYRPTHTKDKTFPCPLTDDRSAFAMSTDVKLKLLDSTSHPIMADSYNSVRLYTNIHTFPLE